MKGNRMTAAEEYVLNRFKEEYPRYFERMKSYDLIDNETAIRVYLDNGDIFYYSHFDNIPGRLAPRSYIGLDNEDQKEFAWRFEFGRRLEEMMLIHGMSREELSELTGISTASISNYITCKRSPTMDKLIKIKNVLGCSMKDLSIFMD